jgi:hypothetical protein
MITQKVALFNNSVFPGTLELLWGIKQTVAERLPLQAYPVSPHPQRK